MNKKMIKQWIEELRDPSRKQTQGALHLDGQGFCCLGVACDIFLDDYWELRPETNIYSIMNTTGRLPECLFTKLGICNFVQEKLIQMNDSGYSFTQIANYLERLIS